MTRLAVAAALAAIMLIGQPALPGEVPRLKVDHATVSVPKGCVSMFPGKPYEFCSWHESPQDESSRYWSVSIGELKMGMTKAARRTLKAGTAEERMAYLEKDHSTAIVEYLASDNPPPGYPTPSPKRVDRADLPAGAQSCFLVDRFHRGPDAQGMFGEGDQPNTFAREIDCFYLTPDASAVWRVWVVVDAELEPGEAKSVRSRVIAASAPIFATLRIGQ